LVHAAPSSTPSPRRTGRPYASQIATVNSHATSNKAEPDRDDAFLCWPGASLGNHRAAASNPRNTPITRLTAAAQGVGVAAGHAFGSGWRTKRWGGHVKRTSRNRRVVTLPDEFPRIVSNFTLNRLNER